MIHLTLDSTPPGGLTSSGSGISGGLSSMGQDLGEHHRSMVSKEEHDGGLARHGAVVVDSEKRCNRTVHPIPDPSQVRTGSRPASSPSHPSSVPDASIISHLPPFYP